MKYHANNHINISGIDADTMCVITACMADTILRPLCDFGINKTLFDYTVALEIVARWVKEFHEQYYSKLKDWDSFEESEENIYNAISWDVFVTCWVNDRFKKFKCGIETNKTLIREFANSGTPKIIIVSKDNLISSVFSTVPVMYATINLNKTDESIITTSESDTVAENLLSVFDKNEPIDASIVKQLIHLGF